MHRNCRKYISEWAARQLRIKDTPVECTPWQLQRVDNHSYAHICCCTFVPAPVHQHLHTPLFICTCVAHLDVTMEHFTFRNIVHPCMSLFVRVST